MKMNKSIPLFVVSILCLWAMVAPLAHASFEDRVRQYEQSDRVRMPPEGAVLFIGSSTIEGWTTLQRDFPTVPVINRGVSGTTYKFLFDMRERIIFPYRASKIVIYSGDNDMGGTTAAAIALEAQTLIDSIHQTAPNAEIIVISVKPSPSREKFREKTQATNALFAKLPASRPWLRYVDTYSWMLDSSGHPRRGLFRSDKLHMNASGYKIWTRALRALVEH